MNQHPISKIILLAALCSLLSACEKPEEKEARYLKRGNALYEQGNYAKARLEYKNAEQVMPTDAEPRYRLGLVDEAEGDPRNAFSNYVGAEQQNAHFHPALLKLANYFIAMEQYDEAEHRLNTVLTETPDDAEGHALRAAVQLRRKNFDGTEKEARTALAKDPANVTAVTVLTGLYIAKKDEPKALAALDDGITRTPQSLPLRLLKVMLYEQSGNVPKVAESYQEVFKLKPTDEVYRVDLAKVFVKSGKLDDAETTLRNGIAAMPENADMKRELVLFLSDNRGVDPAEKQIREWMAANPKSDDLYFWLADVYITHNATDRAVALLEQIVAKDDSDRFSLGARTSLARIQFVKGNKALAEKLVAAVMEKDPGNPDALLIRARMAYDQGRYQEAVSDLRTIIRAHANAKDALQLLAETLLLQGHKDLAIDTQNQLVDSDPGNTPALVRLAQMNMMNGNSKRAMEMLAVATKVAPDFAIGWESAARVAIQAKDSKSADDAIAKLDALPGQHATAIFLKGMLLEKLGNADGAMPLYSEVFTADPASPLGEHALSSYVDAKQRKNQLADAETAIRALKQQTPFTDTLLGGCLLKLGKAQEAAAMFDKAMASGASSQDAYIGRAELYIKDNNLNAAAQLLKKAREIAPSDLRASLMLANIQGKLGHYQEAMALYDGILAQNPTIDVAANNLAQLITDYQSSDSAALEKARQTAERFAGSANPLYLDTLGWVYFRQGNLQQAQVVMEQVMAHKDELLPEVHYHYASLLLKLGKTEQAKEELKQATVDGANYSDLDKAKQMMRSL